MSNTMKTVESTVTIDVEVDEVDGNTTTKFATTAGKTIKTKLADVKLPVDQTLMSFGNSQSDKIKKMIGLNYEQVTEGGVPDVDQLTLNFLSDDISTTFKLGSVAELLPKLPGYDCKQPLVIFMHGFTDDPSLFNFSVVNEAFHSKGHLNILALDASPLIRYMYLRSSTYVRFIGEKLGVTLAAMVEAGLDRKNIHLVGHSLGSHIAGFAGKEFFSLTGTLVGRISGLDPAGPAFSHQDQNLRLAPSDAEFVDVIHTNAGVYGMTSPVGHVDFFPNGGEQQPNTFFQFESHNRVVGLFAESVKNPEAFVARACENWEEFKKDDYTSDISLMGYGCKPGTKGLYFLRTGDEKPYGLGKEGLLYTSEGLVKSAKRVAKRITNMLD